MPRVERVGSDVIIRGVAVFDEHRDDSRPDPMKVVDRAKLEKMVYASNRRCADTEGELPVAIGLHTPQDDQNHAPPPVVGGYKNFRIGTIGKATPRSAIIADFRFPAENFPLVQNFQRRSIEMYPDSMELDTCVLFGSKTPARDLGPLTPMAQYGRSKGACVRYDMNNGADDEEQPMPDMEQPQDGGVTLSAETLQTLAGMISSTIDAKFAELMQPEADADQDGIPNAEDDQPFMGDEMPEEPAAETVPPSDDEEKEKEMYARRDLAIKYERVAKENAELKTKFEAMERREAKERYEKQVVGLQAEGYAIESADEVPYIMSLSDDKQRDAYIERLRKNAKRVPSFQYGRSANPMGYDKRIEDPVQYQPVGGTQDPRSGELTPEQARAAREWAIQNNSDFASGRRHVLANGKA